MLRKRAINFVWLGIFAIGCGGDLGDGSGALPFDDLDLEGARGKADMVSSAQIIDDIDLNSRIDGRFSDRIRVYGFTVEAKAGATVKVRIGTRAGAASSDVAEGQPLDTVAAVYGPMTEDSRGPRIAMSDDDPFGDTEAQLPPLKIAEDGRYLVLMASWNDPGQGSYVIDVRCQGTDFQCRRPVQAVDCDETTRYITGGTVIGSETWKSCNVVLVEHVEVAEDAVLTIRPGVTVKGNYLGTDDFGSVDLEVKGTLQAVGTAERPVVFTALKDGWKGLVLAGPSNTIEHAYVEKARVGIEVRGSNNTFADLNVNSGDTGLYFVAGSAENKVNRLRVSQVRDGIRLSGQADIFDSVLLGSGTEGESGSGIWGDGAEARSRFHRALIAGFPYGLYLHSTQLEVYDSTIVNNRRGILVTGDNAGIQPPYDCPAFPAASDPPPVRPAPPTTWGRDPVFVRCDVINNADYGVQIDAPELLIIEDSNVRGNGQGIRIASHSLHDDSRIVRNNIFENGEGAQVESFHLNGRLDISANYWAQISDPELSASWAMSHSQQMTCAPDDRPNNSCQYNSSSRTYRCGSYTCRVVSGNWRCSATVTASWGGDFSFTGFSPLPLEAGPALETCTEQVQQERREQGL